MTQNELITTIMSINGARLCRSGVSNFVAVPTGEEVDGVPTYLKVSVTTALTKDTKNHVAFNVDAAARTYEEWKAESERKAAERAAKPSRPAGPNPEAQARREALDKAIAALSFSDATATDIYKMLENGGTLPEKTTVMSVGSAAKRLVETGVLTVEEVEKKKHYTTA